MNTQLIVILVSIAVVLFGILFIIIGRMVTKRILGYRQNCTSLTSGTVIEMEERRIGTGHDKSYTWYPHYQFYADGDWVETVGLTGVTRNSLKEGQRVTICYNPENPTQAYAKEEPEASAFKIFGIMGWIIVAFGIVTFVIGMIII